LAELGFAFAPLCFAVAPLCLEVALCCAHAGALTAQSAASNRVALSARRINVPMGGQSGALPAPAVGSTIRAPQQFSGSICSILAHSCVMPSLGAADRFTMNTRTRADHLLVKRGLFESRSKAQAAIDAGLVTADGVRVRKSAQTISTGAVLEAEPAHPYVSRGGLKLAAALAHFRIDPIDRVCLDVGASTGGFTDALLRGGARHIYAVDVGRDQLHPSLRHRSEVVSLEKIDARKLDRSQVAEAVDVIVIDVSFISLKKILAPVLALSASRADMVALIKPQFEVGRKLARKGVVRDVKLHRAACEEIIAFVATLGWEVLGVIESPIPGGDGNREFLLAAHRASS
jgi:23S rRNA (cytidine1920-2'-O)/16S rRNA (cytidine1409-2'-O)-methyltransferase